MYRIVLACEGVPPELGPVAAIDISVTIENYAYAIP